MMDGGDALVIPYNKLNGHWDSNDEIASRHDLTSFLDYIQSLEGCNRKAAQQMIDENWLFNSTIPTGYGLGSSGALTAAAYDLLFEKENNVGQLQKSLAAIESHFHGSSSGLDPLSSYLKKPLHSSDGKILELGDFAIPHNLYIYDSGITRESKPLIKWYKSQLETNSTFQAGIKELSLANQKIINDVISSREYSKTFREISVLQLQHFSRMIPATIRTIWESGLQDDRFYFKLSGAGGGGFFLVYTDNPDCIKGLQKFS